MRDLFGEPLDVVARPYNTTLLQAGRLRPGVAVIRVGIACPSARCWRGKCWGLVAPGPRHRESPNPVLHRQPDPLVRLTPASGAPGPGVDSRCRKTTAMGPWLVLALARKGPGFARMAAPRPPATAIDRKPTGLPRLQKAPGRPRAGSGRSASSPGVLAQANLQPMWRHVWGADVGHNTLGNNYNQASPLPASVGSQCGVRCSERSQTLIDKRERHQLKPTPMCDSLLCCSFERTVVLVGRAPADQSWGWGPDPLSPVAAAGSSDSPSW